MKTFTHLFHLSALATATATATATAKTHHLLVGTFSQPSIYALSFSPANNTLSLTANITTTAAHSWIALSHDNSALYGVSEGAWVSYAIDNGTSGPASGLTHTASVNVTGDCSTTHGIFITQQSQPPYNVYADPFGNCTNVLSTSPSSLALLSSIQNISYASSSGIHGMAFHPSGRTLYSADDSGNAIWTHSVDEATGLLTEVGKVSGPTGSSNPRHAAVHKKGRYMYVVLEETNELAVYTVDGENNLPIYTNITYPLIRNNDDNAAYWSDEVALSPTGNVLWASSRGRASSATGYISAFSLSASGMIEQQLFLADTTTSGGTANSVAPAPFSDDYVALTDSELGFVQVWQFKDGAAEVVARVDLEHGGCCANAVWYD